MSFMGRSEYDRDVGTWSPEGRLFQIEYAMEAIKLGSTALGLVTKDGVLFAVEKKLPNKLMVPSSMEKVFEIDSHMGCAMSGLIADARTLVDHARNECQSHWFTYNEDMDVQSCVHSISDLALDFSDVSDGRRKKTMSRPFGCSLLVGGVNQSTGEAQLWLSDPSGTYTKYKAAAIGSAQEGATSVLATSYKDNMTLAQGEELCLNVLRQMMEEKMTSVNVEIASVTNKDRKYHLYSTAEVDAVINRLPANTLPM